MKTELQIVEQPVVPGQKIQVTKLSVRNYLVHQVCEPLVQMLLGLVEADSSNSAGQASAREVRNLWKGWGLVKLEWNQAKQFRDAPHAVHEEEFYLLMPTMNEVLTVSNVKSKRLAQQLHHLVRVLIGTDSAKMQTWIGPGDIESVELLLSQAETVLTTYFGTGAGDAGKGFDTGVQAPEYAFGQLIPDIDLDEGTMHEPGSLRPQAPVADVADTESIAPKPGLPK